MNNFEERFTEDTLSWQINNPLRCWFIFNNFSDSAIETNTQFHLCRRLDKLCKRHGGHRTIKNVLAVACWPANQHETAFIDPPVCFGVDLTLNIEGNKGPSISIFHIFGGTWPPRPLRQLHACPVSYTSLIKTKYKYNLNAKVQSKYAKWFSICWTLLDLMVDFTVGLPSGHMTAELQRGK